MDRKEEFLTLFTVSLALLACAVLIYMSRTPAITGDAVLDNETMALGIFSFLILVSIISVIGAIIVIKNLKKETELHKRAIISPVLTHPNREIVMYIMKARRQGFDDSQIAENLKEQGWNNKTIKAYL